MSQIFKRIRRFSEKRKQRGRERKGLPEIIQIFHLPILSADFPMTPKDRAPFWPFFGEGFGATSASPLFSRPLCLLLIFNSEERETIRMFWGPPLPGSRCERILFHFLWKMWRIFREKFCRHFSWKLKVGNLRIFSPKFRRVFRPRQRKISPEFRSREFPSQHFPRIKARNAKCENRTYPPYTKNHLRLLIGMQFFCLQLEASCLQLSFCACSCVWELFCLQSEFFFAYNSSFFAYSLSFFAYSGKVCLRSTSTDCKQRSSTVSKEAQL